MVRGIFIVYKRALHRKYTDFFSLLQRIGLPGRVSVCMVLQGNVGVYGHTETLPAPCGSEARTRGSWGRDSGKFPGVYGGKILCRVVFQTWIEMEITLGRSQP